MITLLLVLLPFQVDVQVPQSARPVIDGKLDDACWKEAARFCRDDEHLYVAVTAPKGEKITISLNANGDGNSFYDITLSADGAPKTLYREDNPPWYDITWKPKLETKARAGDAEWTAEVAIPFAGFTLSKRLAAEVPFTVGKSPGRLKGIPPRTFAPNGPAETAPVALGPGSSHPGTTGEVKLELEGFLMGGDPHARGVIWDLAVNEKTGELYVLSVPRVRNPPEIQVYDRQGRYLRMVMPFNPTLPKEKVKDLVLGTAVEDGTPLLLPKRFEIFGAVETSLYGEWWHFPQKIAIAPDGDLILTNLYRGTLWRIRPDGSLPAEGWSSVQSPERNEPFEKTVDLGVKHHGRVHQNEEWYAIRTDSYLPFPELFYPFLAFDKSGDLAISRGFHYKSGGLDSMKQYSVYWEVPRNQERQLPDTPAVFWTMKLRDGAKVDSIRGFGIDGKQAPLIPPGGVPGRKEPSSFLGECGLAFDGDHLLLSDRNENKIRVYGPDRSPLAVLEGKFQKPTAIAADARGHVYVLHGVNEKRILKLRSRNDAEVLATSKPLHAETLQFAIDRPASILWVANGDGLGSLVKLSADDLALQGAWGDTGDALSSPVQQGYVPILNVDPETGHLYVEDDSHFRFGKRGETYRLDQDGKILKRLKGDPKEMPRLETLYGKDGKLYWWEGGKIRRYDRSGKALPFKATGKDELVIDAKAHHVGVYMGMDVDRSGNIYVVNAKSELDVYDPEGNVYKKGLLKLNGAVRGIQVDGEGNIYTLSRQPADLVSDTVLEVYKAPLLVLCKYGPEGGKPVWASPWTGITGRDQVLVWGCGCLRPRLHQAMDEKGYLFVAAWHSVRVIDSKTGKVVGEFGSYGNMDCKGKGSAFPHPELPFGTISAVAVWKDKLFAMDQLNRRIVKCRIVYGR